MSIDLKISERGENLKTTTEHLASCLFKGIKCSKIDSCDLKTWLTEHHAVHLMTQV